jgi:hypothetical protein
LRLCHLSTRSIVRRLASGQCGADDRKIIACAPIGGDQFDAGVDLGFMAGAHVLDATLEDSADVNLVPSARLATAGYRRQATPRIIRCMIELLSIIEHAALGEIIKRVITGAADWAKKLRKPKASVIEKKLVELADKSLPASIPPENREAAIASVVELVKPTFDEIVRYSPNVHNVMMAAKKAVKKAPAKKATPRHWYAKKTPSHRVKSGATKKSPAKKPGAKKAPAKKAATKKAPMRRF